MGMSSNYVRSNETTHSKPNAQPIFLNISILISSSVSSSSYFLHDRFRDVSTPFRNLDWNGMHSSTKHPLAIEPSRRLLSQMISI